MKKRGKLVVIEGADGAGKDTQAELLLASAQDRGMSAALIRYPAYEQTHTGKVVRSYLKGELGEAHPKVASYLFALDRLELRPQLLELLATHDLVIASRYAISNMAYQTTRLPEEERPSFRIWLDTLEYGVLQTPREDAVVFLHLPIELSNKLLAGRDQQGQKRSDIYDTDVQFRTSVLQEYEALCAAEPHWHKINCEEGGAIRTREAIAAEVADYVLTSVVPAAVMAQAS